MIEDVSRETRDKLTHYAHLLEKWTKKINLIAPKTVPDIWDRHIADSAQVAAFASEARSWADLGSGGGLPGVVVAILRPAMEVTLVESDTRKCSFLRTAARELNLNIHVQQNRIEGVDPLLVDAVSARALAPLDVLLGYVEQHLAPNGTALLLKGENWEQEVQKAKETWSFSCDSHPSHNGPGVILKVGDVSRD